MTPFKTINHTGYIEVDHLTQQHYSIKASRAFHAYDSAIKAIDDLLELFKSDIETEIALRNEYVRGLLEKRAVERAELQNQVTKLEEHKASPKSFWARVKTFGRDQDTFCVETFYKIVDLKVKIRSLNELGYYEMSVAKCHEEMAAVKARDEIVAKRAIAFMLDDSISLTSAEVIELARAEDGSLVAKLRKGFDQMVMRNGEAK